mgnify:CR=1 FL=1
MMFAANGDIAFCNPLNIDQVAGRDIVGGDVFASRSTGQRNGWLQRIISAAKCALQRGLVHNNTPGIMVSAKWRILASSFEKMLAV